MRPYLAIIKDSFRAALATKVLYVLLGLITILLLAIAPFHLKETVEWKLNWRWSPPGAKESQANNVVNPKKLVERLVEGHDKPNEKRLIRIWELLPEDLQEKLTSQVSGDEASLNETDDAKDEGPGLSPQRRKLNREYGELVDALNKIIEDPGFYRADDWKGRALSDEADELVSLGVDRLSTNRQRRLNRLLLATTLSPYVTRGETALDFYYGPWRVDIFSQRGFTQQSFSQGLTSLLPVYFDKFVMSIGLLVAILVTSNMIPDMFEPGSLNLLLSKPIFRWGLYIAKFIGGCVFIALCASYLFLGVWLWMGLALGVWDRAMLLSIPLYVLVFAIYFSISSLVGLLYRSPTVSVILTLIFWAFCFGVGVLFNLIEIRMNNVAMRDVVPLAEGALPTDVLQTGYQWNANARNWDSKLEPNMKPDEKMSLSVGMFFAPMNDLPDPVGPLFNPVTGQLLTAKFSFRALGGRGPLPMFVADADQKNFVEVGKFPAGTLKLSMAKGQVLAITGMGEFYRLNQTVLDDCLKSMAADGMASPAGPSDESGDESAGAEGAAEEAAQGATQRQKELFELVGSADDVEIRFRENVAVNQVNGDIAVCDRGTISIFQFDQGEYRKTKSLELNLDFSKRLGCVIEYQGDTIVLAFYNGQVITVDGQNLVELNGYTPELKSPVVSVRGSPDGRWFGLLYRNRDLWILDRQNDATLQKANVTGQGGISAFAFDAKADNDLWVVDRTDRLTQYDLEMGSREQQFVPGGDWLEKAYRYFLVPFYKVCPKPGEFYKLVTYLSTTSDVEQNKSVDLRNSVERADPWSPLWSGLIFMLVMLMIACLIFQFRDY